MSNEPDRPGLMMYNMYTNKSITTKQLQLVFCSPPSTEDDHTMMIIMISCGVGLLVFAIAIFICIKRRKSKNNTNSEEQEAT